MRSETSSLCIALAVSLALLPAAPLAAQLSSIGLSEVGVQWFENEAPGEFDQFGWALASGDFNGDGADDLATGVPGDADPGGSGCSSCGSVVVRYGVPGAGLAAGPAPTVLRQESGQGADNEEFGKALAAADFDGDGFDDLAVGIPFDGPSVLGAVQIFFGAAGGLSAVGSQRLEELDAGQPEHICPLAGFGWALAAGDFDGDPFADLAIGAPWACENNGTALVDGGAVFVAHGGDTGLLPFSGYRISQDSIFIFEEVESGDRFAWTLATGDFDADSFDDLAIGVPGEGHHGALEIIMGSQFGLIFADSAYWAPGALGQVPEIGDQLGWALASADFDGDGHDDLAIGDPFEDPDVSLVENAGTVSVAFGSPAGFDLARTRNLVQDALYGPGSDEPWDQFGFALAAGDFDGDGAADLVVGHPGESVFAPNPGAASVLMGPAPGGRVRAITPGFHGIPGDPFQINQFFGAALAAGDFDATGFSDLAIGVPFFNPTSVENTGAEVVLYGALFADGFELGSPDRWTSVVN